MCKINGKKLGEIRKNAGMSRKELAKMAGVSDSMICNYENGRYNPSDATLEKICMVLKITKDDVEIKNLGYSFVSGESEIVGRVRKRKGFKRYYSPSELENWLCEDKKSTLEEEKAEIKNCIRSASGIANKKYITIYPELLHIPSWQRNTDMAKSMEIKSKYDENKFDPIKGYVKDDLLYCADGAHRVAAYNIFNREAKEENKLKITVEILNCDEDEARETFLGQQAGRKSMTVSDMYRAAVESKEEDYIALKEIMEEKNIQITVEDNILENSIGAINPSGSLLRLVHSKRNLLESVIDLIKELNWCGSSKNAYTMRNIKVLMRIYTVYGKYKTESALKEKCSGAVYFESSVAPIKSNAELYDFLVSEISK